MSSRKKSRGGRPSKFPPEFRRDAVAMVLDESRSIADVARATGVNPGTLGNWVAQERVERGERVGLTVDERADLATVAIFLDDSGHNRFDELAEQTMPIIESFSTTTRLTIA